MEYIEHTLENLFDVHTIVNARKLYCDKKLQFSGERHVCWELQYMAAGNTIVHLNNRFYTLRQGELILFRPDSFHVVYGDGEQDAEMWVISFGASGEALEKIGCGVFTASARCEELLKEVLEDVQTGYWVSEQVDEEALLKPKESTVTGNNQMIRIHIEQILLLLLRSTEDSCGFAGWMGLRIVDHQAFLAERIREYMARHVDGQLRLSQVASAFYVSESTVKTVYKKQFGISLIADYHTRKIERAKVLLCRQDCSIGHIATMLGFENAYYFSNFFKKHTGIAPTTYRKQHTVEKEAE